MNTIYLSKALQDCHTLDQIIALINEGTVEGMGEAGGIEFLPEMLAGQYAYRAAVEAGYGLTIGNLCWHLDYLSENGAVFIPEPALDHALMLARAE